MNRLAYHIHEEGTGYASSWFRSLQLAVESFDTANNQVSRVRATIVEIETDGKNRRKKTGMFDAWGDSILMQPFGMPPVTA